ncbi:hypothetical protein LJR009_002309 [Bosea sp. LjRoot9]
MDLSEFAKGRTISSTGKWRGPIGPKPELLDDLLPYLYENCRHRPLRSWVRIKTSLRAAWRVLDELPIGFKVARIADLTDAHGGFLRRSLGGLYVDVARILLSSRQHHGLPPLNWPPSYNAPLAMIETIDDATTRRVYRAIKSEVRAIKLMWQTGDDLIQRDHVSDATVDSKARSFLQTFFEKHVQPLPASAWDVPDQVRKGVLIPTYRVPGMDGPTDPAEKADAGVGGLSEALRWKYPSAWEATCFLLLLLVLTGWNQDTALNLDLDGDWCRLHPLNNDLAVIQAKKGKTETIQTAICLRKPELYPERLLQALIARTEPLRQELRRQLAEVETQINEAAAPTAELQREFDRLYIMIRSPWIYVNRSDFSVGCLLPWQTFKYPGVVLRAIVAKYDIRGSKGGVVEIKPGDFRDAWIGFSYVHSGYSWLIAKIAAGHRSMDALRNYFRQRRWRGYSEERVSALLSVIWTEIRGRRLIDGAVLRQMVERGEITDQERERLEQGRNRTRMGMGCRDFNHPPPEIAPGHPSGVGCMVQRCVLCRHALLFADSIEGLCRRKAELEHVCANLGMITWLESSFPDEEEVLDEALNLFDRALVEVRIEFWRSKIAAGTHFVFEFQGYYGARG